MTASRSLSRPGRAGAGRLPPASGRAPGRTHTNLGADIARRRLSDAETNARRRTDRERLEHSGRELLTSDGWQRRIGVRATNGLARYSPLVSGRLRARPAGGRDAVERRQALMSWMGVVLS